jgi:hypothetical protein
MCAILLTFFIFANISINKFDVVKVKKEKAKPLMRCRPSFYGMAETVEDNWLREWKT